MAPKLKKNSQNRSEPKLLRNTRANGALLPKLGSRRRPLETIQEISGGSSKSDDPFDQLCRSPLKQPVQFKPLTFWAQKVEDLNNASVQKKNKSKKTDLYELSSDDSYEKKIKIKRKPKPRRKKENIQSFVSDYIKSTSKLSRSLDTDHKRRKAAQSEALLIKERVLMKKAEEEQNSSLLTLGNKPVIFGLSSTPGKGKRLNLVQPSFFGFYSPIRCNASVNIENSLKPTIYNSFRKRKSELIPDSLLTEPIESDNKKSNRFTVFENNERQDTDNSDLSILRKCDSPRSKADFLPACSQSFTECKQSTNPENDGHDASDVKNGTPINKNVTLRSRNRRCKGGSSTSERSSTGKKSPFTDRLIDPNMLSNSPRNQADIQLARSQSQQSANPGDDGQDAPRESHGEPLDKNVTLRRRNRRHKGGSSTSERSSTGKKSPFTDRLSKSNFPRNRTDFQLALSPQSQQSANPGDDCQDAPRESHGEPIDTNVTLRSRNRRRLVDKCVSEDVADASDSAKLSCKSDVSSNVDDVFPACARPTSTSEQSSINYGDDYEDSLNGEHFLGFSPSDVLTCLNVGSNKRYGSEGNVSLQSSPKPGVDLDYVHQNSTMTRHRGQSKSTSKKSSTGNDSPLSKDFIGNIDDARRHKNITLRRRHGCLSSTNIEKREELVGLVENNVSLIEKTSFHTPKQDLGATSIGSRNSNSDSEAPEVSKYFSAPSPSSSPSFIESSSNLESDQETETNRLNVKTPPTKIICTSPVSSEGEDGLASIGLLSAAVLMPGKKHNRSRLVMRKWQSGRLTLHDMSLMPLAPPTRGRNYEPFVESLLQKQPGLEETILLNASSVAPQFSKRPRTRSMAARASRPFDSSMIVPFRKKGPSVITLNTDNVLLARRNKTALLSSTMNKTVHWQDSRLELPKKRKSTFMRSSLMGKSVMQDPGFEELYGNISVRVLPCEDHDPTPFRSAYNIHDGSTSKASETLAESTVWTARDVILSRCGQTEPLEFGKYFNELTLPDCKKIGEGVFGEVFVYNSPTRGLTVFKVIPIEGDLKVNDEPQKAFSEILSEIVISMELSNLRNGIDQKCSGFAELRRVWCVVGEYPELLQDLWNDFDIEKQSSNDSPAFFPDDQLYIVLELGHGGRDLEAFPFRNVQQAVAAFKQAAFSLAVAEKALKFEHRDFHWGNVLLSETNEKTISFTLDGEDYSVASEGVKVTIIDFTLSRMTFEGCSVFNDLAVDPALFTASAEEDYQFEIYRMMKKETENNWELFRPRTNVFWLHYTLDKMLMKVKSKGRTAAAKKLRAWFDSALQFQDTSELCLKCFS